MSSSTKKRSKDKYCKSCGQNITSNEERRVMISTNSYDKLRASEYCKDHEFKYGGHKCKPEWCRKCKYLKIYRISFDDSVYKMNDKDERGDL